MLARALCLGLVAELGLYAVAILALWPGDAATSGRLAVAVIVLALVVRGAILAITWGYVLAWRQALSPALRIGPGVALAMVVVDYLALLALFVVVQPLERLFLGPDRLHRQGPGEPPPLVLIHGYHCNRGFWWWLRRRLLAAGRQVATISLEPIFADIDAYADQLAGRVDVVRRVTGADRVVLVGHSMGGVVARAYVRRYGAAAVARVVSLGSPHHGSVLADHFGLGPNGRQMRRGSAWLQALERESPNVPSVSIYSVHDNFVVPQRSSSSTGRRTSSCRGWGISGWHSPRGSAQHFWRRLRERIRGFSLAY